MIDQLDFQFFTIGQLICTVGKFKWKSIDKIQIQICERCGAVYFKTEYSEKYITDSSNYPILKEYKDWIKQMTFEAKMQDENETVKSAWEQYQVALKLSKK